MDEGIGEECGIAAVYLENGSKDENAAFYLYRMLLNMQNRGQLAAGITTYNKKRDQIINTYRNLGTVNEAFSTNNPIKTAYIFKKYSGDRGIGHIRYATFGKNEKSYAQPFERHHGKKFKWFSFAFNGNIANFQELKKELNEEGYHLIQNTDTEAMMHYLSLEIRDSGGQKRGLTEVFSNLSKKFDGAYNIVFMNAEGEIAIVRDPMGFRPLCYGKNKDKTLIASESNALINCGITKFDSLEPGKIILIKDGKMEIKKFAECKRKAHCMFEWVYFANVSSVLNGKSVYITRTNLGKNLAKLETEKITKEHIVVPVPDTAKAAGDSFAFALGLPSHEGLIRNRHVGRTFIENVNRSDKVKNKYTVQKEILKGKKVLLVDDSIVRGTTIGEIVKYIKDVGEAKEVHLRVSCPPIMCPCFYGIDMSTVRELFACRYFNELEHEFLPDEVLKKMAKEMGADSLIYQSVSGLIDAIGLPKEELCLACLNGDYPTEWGKKLYKESLKNKDKKKRTYE